MKKYALYMLSLLSIGSLSSCYTTQSVPYNTYTMQMTDSVGNPDQISTACTHVDSNLSVGFEFLKTDISMVLKNNSNSTIKINWDECLFIKNDIPSKVMHSGVKYTDRNQSMPPSIIPKGTLHTDVIVPTDNVYWKEGYYSQYGSSPGGWEKKDILPTSTTNIGDKVSLYMPINVGTTTQEYNFNFKVKDSKTEYKEVKTVNFWGTFGLALLPSLLVLVLL